MATIGGLSSGTSGSVSMYGASMKGYGGLASGMDTDSLIEGMTAGTRTKIQELLKKKTTYGWQMEAYRSVTDKLVGFSAKYLDITNSSSPYRSSFFDKSLVSIKGSNANNISITGASNSLDSLKVLGVKQLAKDSNMVTDRNGSIQSLDTGSIKFGEQVVTQDLDGSTITFTYGTDKYTIRLNAGAEIKGTDKVEDYSTMDSAIESINALLSNTSLNGTTGGKLGSKVKFEMAADGKRLTIKGENLMGNSLSLSGGSKIALQALGFMDAGGTLINEGKISATGSLTGMEFPYATMTTTRNFADVMGGKEMSFSYNGTTKTIKLPTADIIKRDWLGDADSLDPTADQAAIESGFEMMRSHIQSELNKSFGTSKINVTSNGTAGSLSLSFNTSDDSAILKITNAGSGLMGEKGVFATSYSTTNRLNLDAKVGSSGLNGILGKLGGVVSTAPDGKKTYAVTDYNDADGNLLIKINGKKIEGLTVDSSISDVINKINSSDAGVKIKYLETADRFTATATEHGELGAIEFNDGGSNNPTDFMALLLGDNAAEKVVKGQDSIMTVAYEGNVQKEIKRDSNSFNMDGATFNLKGEFGYETVREQKKDADGNLMFEADGTTPIMEDVKRLKADSEPVTFTTSVDTEKVSKVISEMVEDYNAAIKLVNELVSTKPDRDYGPLTDDEKNQLSEDQIKQLETKAKEGILFNDSLLVSLSDKLRSVFSGVTDAGTLKHIGINMSNSYSDNGKISFDVEKFKAALQEDPELIKDLFTKASDEDTKGGISVRMKAITDDFARINGSVKGRLITKAGSALAPSSLLQNSLQKMRDDIDDDVDILRDKLQTEIDRYTRQFSSLEQLISQMNSQSSWFSQMTG